MNGRSSIEQQLRRYADAIHPDGYVEAGDTEQGWVRRGPSVGTTWLIAAAAVIVLLGLAALAQRRPAQVVETGDFVQQPTEVGQPPDPEASPDDPAAAATPTPISPTPVPTPAVAPPAYDVPDTGDMRTREDGLAVMYAQLVLLDECMAAQNAEVTMPTDDEWIELFGSWRPHGILGIGTEGAARRIGYQSDGWGGMGSPSQGVAFQAMDPDQEAAWSEALDGCWPSVHEQLGDYQNGQIYYRDALSIGSDATQGERFRDDPSLATAIVEWQDCVRAATGIEADTPNTLARRFAFSGAAGDRELEVAVADVRCQDETDLVATFYRARTARVRAELGAEAAIFDDYARFLIESTRLARQVLDERGITPPSLD